MGSFMVRAGLAALLSVSALTACSGASATDPKAALTREPFFIRGEITQAPRSQRVVCA